MTNNPISRIAIISAGQMGPNIAVATALVRYSTIHIGNTLPSSKH